MGKKVGCVFCEKNSQEYLLENDLAVAFWDIHPMTKGHLLIIPKDHEETFFDLSDQQKRAMDKLLVEAKKMLDEMYHPAGYNIFVHVGKRAGQKVMHAHWHLVPAY
ncbi:HIT family protein [Pediococcus claussenii]|uniref:Histidine triad (HIT) domain protein n=1 Tax=Pediococcus claussenii (strain ATCC BAA-344 / DSM 14800 / JCM 18046 / KCTC 3811 / LMG 21948 / P06) TaxID=701521 RepID=G8PBW6_PEDCP|nr:HIT family protein [Pediococcus claussenii]AEV96024.1 Histidine triad (HIT) domain protein [Pediococcus claussenii ATCC BAA-344]ANZ69509.1 HIT family hydrolase [Pediococcus claussenii]ANZ71328.1 HIT family hydrolase [Pediococcus claussenii]KRN19450.1 hypothetical protein IV79_GL001503 [Pediococcus claussenii]